MCGSDLSVFISRIGSELFVVIRAAYGSPQGAQGFDRGTESSSRRNRPRQARRRWENNIARRRWDSRAATTSVRELPLSALRDELSVREEPHPTVMSADQLFYNKAGRSQARKWPSGKASSEGRARGSLRVGRSGSVTGSQAHLPKARRCGRASGLLCARRAELWIVTRRRWKRPQGGRSLGESLAGAALGGSSQPEAGTSLRCFSAPKLCASPRGENGRSSSSSAENKCGVFLYAWQLSGRE
ncbi:Double-stranded RNA-binding protein 5, partial [Ophiophagus hannah]